MSRAHVASTSSPGRGLWLRHGITARRAGKASRMGSPPTLAKYGSSPSAVIAFTPQTPFDMLPGNLRPPGRRVIKPRLRAASLRHVKYWIIKV